MCANPLDPTPCVEQATTLNYTWQFFFLKEKQLPAPVYTAVSAPVIWLCGRRDSKKKLEHRDKQKRGRDSQKKKADAEAKRTRAPKR
jgi:hypothetical protein